MKHCLVITIDVEPDCTPSWRYSDPLTFSGVSIGIAERLQPLFTRCNIIPTYLVNNVVLEDQNSVAVLKSLPGKFELGTHLHPEFIEPEKAEFDYAGKKGEANSCFYTTSVETRKIENITALFIQQFGYPPTSFRAGRFSAGNNTIQSLQKFGYKVDTSVTPTVRWSDRSREHPVDFRKAPHQPYWVDDTIMKKSFARKSLLEVPVSIVSERLTAPQWIKYVARQKQLPFNGSRSVWLRPVLSGMKDFEMIIEKIDRESITQGVIVYNMMFHNVEVMPGLSPYATSESSCRQYLELLEAFFQYTNSKKIESTNVSSLYERFQSK